MQVHDKYKKKIPKYLFFFELSEEFRRDSKMSLN